MPSTTTRTTWKRRYPLTGLTSAMLLGRTPVTKRRRVIKGSYRTTGNYGRYPPLGQELKFKDTAGSSGVVGTTGTIAPNTIVTIPAGTGESERVGRKVTIRSVHLSCVTALNSGSLINNTDDGLRVIVYWDKQCNGTAATVTDILETADYLSYNNLSNKNRFRVLMDKRVDLNTQAFGSNGTTHAYGPMGKTHQWHMRCNVPIEYSSTTGAIGEVRSNNIGCLVISDQGFATFNYNFRVRFSDN